MTNPLKLVFLDAATVGPVDNLSELAALGELTRYASTRPDERISRIQGHNVVITNKVIIDRDVMDACPGIELIGIVATGMNNVDLDYAKQKGVAVKNVAGYSTASVTQCTFAMLFYLMNASRYYDEYVKSGKYAQSPIFTHLDREFGELAGRQVGIIGLGTIGRSVAGVARAFGANVVYHSTSGKNLDVAEYRHLPLEELLATSDVVSIHCPLNDQTQNLLDEHRLRRMKPSAYLLNMGRGGIVDEKALVRLLDDNGLAGAALDVLATEPVAANSPLLKVRNRERLYITPHIAWASIEARRRLIERTAQSIKHHFGMS